ncbi:uncharacterized protein LOC114871360 isoform X2 [Osmia bicornis bicornis]|uniref:uncharacterized protein LOC114871360 isoform X2 n=1 Tax=Osmia bicornis bicornis TaxID=1437191 RepID=UPI0010F7A581|nr:uncharacterized protein LOC114871360 isoform X2 [Osmia bicornis bicornis]
MSSNYFEKLKLQARQLDDNIEKLSTAWKLPQRFIGGYAKPTEETNGHIEALWNTIKNAQVEKEEIKKQMANDSGTLDMEQFLQELTEEYNHIKTQCDNLNIVLAEYGYRYSDSDTLDHTVIGNGEKS